MKSANPATRLFSALAVPALCLVACASVPSEGTAQSENAWTSDAGDAAANGGASDVLAPVQVPAYAADDANGPLKMRWSIEDGPVTEGADAGVKIVLSGTDRRFRVQAATPVAGGKPVVYLEFGRGAAAIAPGTYSCADVQAIALVLLPSGEKLLTVVDGAPQRDCNVVIDEATPQPNGPKTRYVRGHFEAMVGPRTDGNARVTKVVGAFAGRFIDSTL